MSNARASRCRAILTCFTLLLAAGGLLPDAARAGESPPAFSKAFTPSTIGPGSVSTLRFDIDNGDGGAGVSDLAFTDTLPAGMTIASPANVVSNCGGTVSAPNGGTAISLTDGQVGPFATCRILVDVTSSTPGTHMNVTGDLTSTAGNSGTASADLTVDTGRPGFLKSFSPSTVPRGQRSTLTFVIDNSANPSAVDSLSFTDNLPTGMVIASPPNAATDCTGGILTAGPGTSVISYTFTFFGFDASVAAGSICTVTVDVIATGSGALGNTTGELTSRQPPSNIVSSGKAAAVLTATSDPLHLIKAFTDDPVPPGGEVTLRFTIINFDRDVAATAITFTDDLDATLSGLVAVGLPLADPCGAGSQLTGTDLLTLTGGTLPPSGSCIFSVTLQVPAAAAQGAYLNTTSSITGDVGGSPVVGGPASETLYVRAAPLLTKTFTDDPVVAGGTVTLEFSITNTSATSSATDISFQDVFVDEIPSAAATPADGFCGAGSMLVFTPRADFNPSSLTVTGANLGPGASCTFDVTLDVDPTAANGTYPNVTSSVTATVDGQTVTGNPASDDLLIVAAPELSKAFIDDPVVPGGTMTLEFTIDHSDNAPGDATGIAFTDDLDAALTGLMAVGLPLNDVCGAGSQIDGTSLLTFTGGSLAPGASCTFSVTVQVPAGATAGIYTNTTSDVTATVLALAVTGSAAVGQFEVVELTITKEFTDDPVAPGDTVTLEFVITNASPTASATNITFTDDLDQVLENLVAVGLPATDVCGAGSQISGTGFLTFIGGSLAPSTSCTFSVTLQVPAAAPPGEYLNATSPLSADLDGSPVVVSGATGLMTVLGTLSFTKSFTNDPVTAGSTVNLEFTIVFTGVTSATDITFTDNLDAVLPGLVATGLPASDVCGAGSQLSGTSLITLTGGNLAAGASCTFSVTLQVPVDAPPGIFQNVTSTLDATINATPATAPAATDRLRVVFLFIVQKATEGFDADTPPGPTLNIGDPVNWTYMVTNSGNEALTNVTVTDNQGVAVSCPLTTLNIGQSMVCTGSGTVIAGQYANLGMAGAVTAVSGRPISASDPSHYFGADLAGPTVALVNSVDDTGDGQLDECESALVPISQLLLTFDEAMELVPVTDPANYLLVGAGEDEDIATVACGGPVGDDLAISITGVSYDGGSNTATLDLERVLGDSAHRLFACPTLVDLAGNPLDGDDDGSPGDEFVRNFRADQGNRFLNGQFDCTIDEWAAVNTTGSIAHSTVDVAGASISGSAELLNPSVTGTPESFSLSQCGVATSDQLERLVGRARVDTEPATILDLNVECEFFDAADCGGASLGLVGTAQQIQDTGGFFSEVLVRLQSPVGTASGLCTFEFVAPAGETFDAFLDKLVFDANPPFFEDGFESGDTSAWSGSVP